MSLMSIIPGGSLTAIGIAIAGAIGVLWRVFVAGKKSERTKRQKAVIKSQSDQLEMHRDATKHERDVSKMTDDELEKEAAKWDR